MSFNKFTGLFGFSCFNEYIQIASQLHIRLRAI
jgi:hypothetical protein